MLENVILTAVQNSAPGSFFGFLGSREPMEGKDRMHFSPHFDGRLAESREEPCFALSRKVGSRQTQWPFSCEKCGPMHAS